MLPLMERLGVPLATLAARLARPQQRMLLTWGLLSLTRRLSWHNIRSTRALLLWLLESLVLGLPVKMLALLAVLTFVKALLLRQDL